ncbi:cell death abnormality protein 1-like [Mytilus edulis]|uniref:cell death abnormality protein 1-like n=1 Tax=Mytilus edulis TaxID=6550 RepID=UPI0039EEB386
MGCDDWYFGNNCTRQCHCLETPCDTDDGICSPEGCKEGWHGKSCDQACDDWYFGYNCAWKCYCMAGPCNLLTGECPPGGCKKGWHGVACEVSAVTDENKALQSIQIGLFIGGFLLGIMMTAAVCYLAWKRRKLRKNKNNLTPNGTALQSSSYQKPRGNAEYAIFPPASNQFTDRTCSQTVTMQNNREAWWMFQFSVGFAHITDIIIYYREGFARRMDGFQLYVTNTSNIPPLGYLCYADTDPGFPDITQTISCNQIGNYVIYYDTKGSDEGGSVPGPIIELCYVAINGCPMRYWGSNCDKFCPENCVGQHCFIGNGSCVWGCNAENCLGDKCNRETSVCIDGCKTRRTGHYCNKYNMATESLVSQYPNGSEPTNKANDGYKISCSRTQGHNVEFQVDLKKESIVTGIYITLGELTTKNGIHSVYASNTSIWTDGIMLYNDNVLPKEIHFNEVFRYLTYLPTIEGLSFDLEVCEIGIIGCPPSQYGPVCDQKCPENCHGPCNLETGLCIFGCLHGWTGNECKNGKLFK